MNIYVGNLSYDATEDDLLRLFSNYGTVERVSIIIDRNTGRSRGFGFVEMTDETQARQAIEELDGTDFQGRSIKVNQAKPKPEGTRRSSYGGGRRNFNRR